MDSLDRLVLTLSCPGTASKFRPCVMLAIWNNYESLGTKLNNKESPNGRLVLDDHESEAKKIGLGFRLGR